MNYQLTNAKQLLTIIIFWSNRQMEIEFKVLVFCIKFKLELKR